MEKRKPRSFSAAYKTEIVDLVRATGKSIGAVAEDLGLGETAVRAWVRQAAIDGSGGGVGALTSAERRELTELRRRVKTLDDDAGRRAVLSLSYDRTRRRPDRIRLVGRSALSPR
jgi:transposase